MATSQHNEKAPLLKEKTPMLNYTKRYDQVSWRSADTDFEIDPAASSADENLKVNVKATKPVGFCTKRNRKLIALVVVVVVFLAIMASLIYLYYSKTSPIPISKTPVVSTNCGDMTGVIETLKKDNKEIEIYTFKGIPYALPPNGDLRWSAPVSFNENRSSCWSGVFEANSHGSVCIQNGTGGNMQGSEDCLYLNVYTPSLKRKLPVFIWLHGGSYMTGSGHQLGMTPDNEFVTSMDVVAVSLNFRLNLFGFLSLKELWQKGKSYGNYGFMDQILALKWVQSNIKNFGGDPNSVTICGQSFGGTSIFGLLASPLAGGLFHKAISMSGSPKFDKAYTDASAENQVFLNETACTQTNDTRQCLYNLKATEILNATLKFLNSNIFTKRYDFPTKSIHYPSLAVIDPIVIPKPPKNLKNLSFKGKKVSVLVGSAAQEIGISPFVTFDEKSWTDYYLYLKKKLDPFSTKYIDIVLGKLYSNTTKNLTKEFSAELMHETISSDVLENCPINQLAHQFMESSHHNVYQYVIAHKPSKPLPLHGFQSKNAFNSWETIALFNFKRLEQFDYKPSLDDINFQDTLRKNFKHFMMYGHPANTDWQKKETAIFNDRGDIDVLMSQYHEQQCQFWNNVANGFTSYAWSD
ncbi:para-nitrobenzyl esterase-like isoform X1 [Hydractinia symbiolongicarpus]|uniref:para-nitrobenzyl esterase-like isoform X1 n=1 Tax=Hydractinia symbiolongicarpus TaxID=13093 RepID=UPI002550BB45|nr:para-nitrobenzyl esterase-like isoform X1 [Hydractinia symbiolongicarpus]